MIPDTAANSNSLALHVVHMHVCVWYIVHVSLMSHMLLHVLLSDCMQCCNIPMDWRYMHEN